ncbi:DUF2975 domain-containing protein [Phytoactinopolyspora halophila]|nr:DUF2975 domain-containing protein [Phytoactinopolyspora halophila]
MTTRRAFRIGGWIALVAGTFVAAAAVTTAVVGVLALTGKVTYPADIEVGPFSVQSTISMPVALYADVCESADIRATTSASECFRNFLHDDLGSTTEQVRRQDADVRPTVAKLRGEVELVSTGGWSPYVAATVTRGVIGLAVLSGLLLLLWRLLTTAAAGEAFSNRTVRHLRAIGGLVIAISVLEPAVNHFTSAMQVGYSMESFGIGPHLTPFSAGVYPDDVNLGQLALGGLILLIAEIFRHGAAIESERRLTV